MLRAALSRSRKKKAAANEDYDAAAEQKRHEAEFEAAIEAAASANMNPRLSAEELRKRKEQAVEAEDFQEAARLRELQRCAALDAELARMGRAKRMAAEAEDFDAAHALKSREQELHTRRDAWRRGREWAALEAALAYARAAKLDPSVDLELAGKLASLEAPAAVLAQPVGVPRRKRAAGVP